MIAFAVPYYRPVIEAMKGKNLSAMRAPLPLYSVHCNPVLWLPFNQPARKAFTCAISPAIGYRPLATFGEMGAINTGQCLMYIHNHIRLNVNPATVLLPGWLCRLASTLVPVRRPLTQTYLIKFLLIVFMSNSGRLDFPVHFVTFMLSSFKISLLISLFCRLITDRTSSISCAKYVSIIPFYWCEL